MGFAYSSALRGLWSGGLHRVHVPLGTEADRASPFVSGVSALRELLNKTMPFKKRTIALFDSGPVEPD